MQKLQVVQIKKALSAVTPKASKIIPIPKRNESMCNNSTNLENNQDIPSSPRKGAILEGFVSCFYILRKQGGTYKKVCCFLDEDNVKRAYSLIKQAFPKEQIYICDEVVEKQSFSFWEYARKHIKSLKKLINCLAFHL